MQVSVKSMPDVSRPNEWCQELGHREDCRAAAISLQKLDLWLSGQNATHSKRGARSRLHVPPFCLSLPHLFVDGIPSWNAAPFARGARCSFSRRRIPADRCGAQQPHTLLHGLGHFLSKRSLSPECLSEHSQFDAVRQLLLSGSTQPSSWLHLYNITNGFPEPTHYLHAADPQWVHQNE